jgi:hypothetical protein
MSNKARFHRASCAIVLLLAICGRGAMAADAACAGPARFGPTTASARPVPFSDARDYRAVFQQCRDAGGRARLATRRFVLGDAKLLLTVDPATLETSVESEACWTCADTTDAAQADTRFVGAVMAASQAPGAAPSAHPDYLRNAGLAHGAGEGAFITGDLCPSGKPLDRGFFTALSSPASATPIALSISGVWLTHHGEDFQWLREQARTGALAITWVNHSFHHPYAPGRPLGGNFLLEPGVDISAEVFDTERLLLANGETPSAFFRFPGLISNGAQMSFLRENHLIALGADGWLVFSPPLRPGAIVLVHPNGNEPAGLRRFASLRASGALRGPFRPLAQAPR